MTKKEQIEAAKRLFPAQALAWRRKTRPFFPHDDLNLIHEFEKTLSPAESEAYQRHLIKISVKVSRLFPSQREYPMQGYVIHAKASERLQAILATKGILKA